MSARMPFVPLGSAPPKTPAPGPVPSFIANLSHPLHRGSGQLDAANPLPLAGILGQRTVSHGASASKNISSLDIIRSQTTAPAKCVSPTIQLGADQQTGDNNLDRIISPTPLRVSDHKSPLLASSAEKFKTPDHQFHYNDSFGTSPDHSTGSFGFSNAHISTDAHQRGPPVHQLPSPVSFDQSRPPTDHFQLNTTASFQTSTPYMRGHETEFIRAQRVFPQNNYGQRNRHAVQQQVETSMIRKRSRERYAIENCEQDQTSKRQKVAQHLQDVERPTDVSTPVDHADLAGSDTLSHQCVLSQVFPGEVENFLRGRMEDFGSRVRFWQDASEEEWEQGLEELKGRFSNLLQKTEDYMKRKHKVFTKLEDRIKQHEELLIDREKALQAAKENMLDICKNVVAG